MRGHYCENYPKFILKLTPKKKKMNNKTYSSFEEIDNDIRLLRLEKEIDKLSLTQQVSTSAESLSPKNLLANTWVSLLFNNKRWINIALGYGMQLLAKRYLNKNR